MEIVSKKKFMILQFLVRGGQVCPAMPRLAYTYHGYVMFIKICSCFNKITGLYDHQYLRKESSSVLDCVNRGSHRGKETSGSTTFGSAWVGVTSQAQTCHLSGLPKWHGQVKIVQYEI